MTSRSLAKLALVACLTLPAWGLAQEEDDLLAPLTPDPAKPQPKKERVRRKKAPKPKPPPVDDDVLAPLSLSPELLVSVGEVKGARLFVDGKDLGLVTGQPVPLEAGEHRVTVKRPGFADFSVMVRMADGEREELDVLLDPVAGVLTVQANVPGAEVVVDGKSAGKAPLRELLLSPGTHEVRVSKEGHVTEVSKLSIRAGKDYTLNALLQPGVNVAAADRPERQNLEPSSAGTRSPLGPAPGPAASAAKGAPWYGQWYVWAGAAAVVAAAAGGTYAVVQGTQPSFTPEEVCHGPCDDVVNGLYVRVGGGTF